MANEPGTKVLLKVGDGGTPTELFNSLAGQQDTEMSGEATTDDITDKDNAGWGGTLNVLRNMTVTASGKAKWPDTTGLDALRTAWEAGSDVNCEVVLNAAGSKYSGAFQVSSFNVSGSHAGATSYSVTLQNNGTVTYAAS